LRLCKQKREGSSSPRLAKACACRRRKKKNFRKAGQHSREASPSCQKEVEARGRKGRRTGRRGLWGKRDVGGRGGLSLSRRKGLEDRRRNERRSEKKVSRLWEKIRSPRSETKRRCGRARTPEGEEKTRGRSRDQSEGMKSDFKGKTGKRGSAGAVYGKKGTRDRKSALFRGKPRVKTRISLAHRRQQSIGDVRKKRVTKSTVLGPIVKVKKEQDRETRAAEAISG